MRIYIDLDTQQIVTGLGTRTPINELPFKRGDSSRIEVVYFRGVTQTQLAEGASGKFALKELGRYDGNPVVSDGEWTLEGTGANAIYVFTPSFNTVALNDLLEHGDANANNDVASVTLMGEIEWTIGTQVYSTQTFNAPVANDVNKPADGTPQAGANPLDWLAANGIVYNPAITDFVGGGAARLDGIVTADVAVGRMQLLVVGAFWHVYRLRSGTTGESSPYYIRPDDYHADTNAKYWSLDQVRVGGVETSELLIIGTGGQSLLTASALTDAREHLLPDRDGTLVVGIPEHATLAAANAAIGAIGAVFYNLSTSRYEITTDVS